MIKVGLLTIMAEVAVMMVVMTVVMMVVMRVVMAIFGVIALKAENAITALRAARYIFFDPLYVMLMIALMMYASCNIVMVKMTLRAMP